MYLSSVLYLCPSPSPVNISISVISSRIVSIWICVWISNSPSLVSQNLFTVTVNKNLGKTYKGGNNYSNIYFFFPLRLLKTAAWYRKVDTFETKQERDMQRVVQWRVCSHLEVTAGQSVLCQKSRSDWEASFGVVTTAVRKTCERKAGKALEHTWHLWQKRLYAHGKQEPTRATAAALTPTV